MVKIDPMACAYVVLAHRDPEQLERLAAALDPAEVFLHVDSRVDPGPYQDLRAAAGDVHHLPRIATSWASWKLVEATLTGLRMAVEATDASHVAVLSGQDMPLHSPAEIDDYLPPGKSALAVRELPQAVFGRDGGLNRVRYWHTPVARRKVRLWPRRLPRPLTSAWAAPQWCVLAREAIDDLLDFGDRHPELARFYRHVWIPDEGYIPTMLMHTPSRDRLMTENYWFMRWRPQAAHPAVLDESDFEDLAAAARGPSEVCGYAPIKLFARKFDSQRSARLLDALERVLTT